MDNSSSLTPEVINGLFQSACQAHQEGHLEEAKTLYLKILDYIDAPLLHYNLGLIYYSQEKTDIACSHFERAHSGDPNDIDSLFNLALCQKDSGRLEDATLAYLKLLDLDSDNIDALYNLAGCYREQRMDEEAITFYLRVLDLAPDHQSATSNLAYMYQLGGHTDRAIDYYRKLLELVPGHEAAQHMLSSLVGNTPESSPESYVRELFDNYSDHYEESLVKNLRYDVPGQLRVQVDNTVDLSTGFRHGIDLGCGTGLSGIAFKDIVSVLDGIDLSEKMIALAREKGIYQSLLVGTINEALQQTSHCYDFVIAADVFAYLGDLNQTFRLLSRCTLSQACFCFSTETGLQDGYSLSPSGRFTHSPSYVHALAEEFGWSVNLQQTTDLRMERGGWVTGNLWILKKH